MSKYGERPVPEYIPPPPAAALEPEKPNEAQKKIAEKMRSDAEKKLNGGKKYTDYNVEFFINNGDIYCFRVGVDDGVINVRGEYCGGMVDEVKAKKINDPKTEPMKLNW